MSVFFCFLVVTWRVAANQNVTTKTPLDFRVVLSDERRIFHNSDYVNYDLLMRGGDYETMRAARCSFNNLFRDEPGNKVQLLKNGVVVAEQKVGMVSLVGRRTLNGVEYERMGSGWHTRSMPDAYDFNSADEYQIREMCGDLVSQPSDAFRIEPVGQTRNNLQISIRPAQSSYRVGQPVLVEVEVRNKGKKPFLCAVPQADDEFARWGWSVTVSDFKQGVGLNDDRPGGINAFERECIFDDECIKRFQQAQLALLHPVATRTAIFDLSKLRYGDGDSAVMFGGKAGKFAITVSTSLGEGTPRDEVFDVWHGQAYSNSIVVEIEAAP